LIHRAIDKKIIANEIETKSLIANVQRAITEFIENIRNETLEYNRRDSLITNIDKENWLVTIDAFRKDIDLLMTTNTIDEQESINLLHEIQIFSQFLIGFNDNLEKKTLKNDLLKIKGQIIQVKEEFDLLFYSDRYFSKKEFQSWVLKWSHLIQLIQAAIKKDLVELDFFGAVTRVNNAYREGNNWIETRNKCFVKLELERYREFFETVESHPLNDEQREAILTDEANTLIIAGAGSGKTSTIVGKTKYIVKKGLAKPDEILLIAFNKNVVGEMEERLQNRYSANIPVKTYHGLGLQIIAESIGIMPSVSKLASDRAKLPAKISDFLLSRMNDKFFAQIFNDYFLFYASPYKSAFEFTSIKEYLDYLRRYDIRSLKGERVRSFEECLIANFLYSNGIEYKYEMPYEFEEADLKHPQYRPDFYLPKYRIYIEHFGISRDGKTAPFVPQEDYLQKMRWKRQIHFENKTDLVETYSYERKEGILLSSLEKKLIGKGVTFKQIAQETIFKDLNELGRINRFSSLLSNFLNLYKSGSNNLEEIRRKVSLTDQRTLAFLKIFETIYGDYSAFLQENKEIDFNDMLNESINKLINEKWQPKFKYILVDEFQDISLSRYRLLKMILEKSNAKLFCVGDDWQSIYRFNGSDLSIMVEFEKMFGFSETRFLQETFRFSDKLCDLSTKFILENPLQIKKQIISKRSQSTPSVTIVNNNTEKALKEIFTLLSRENKHAKVLVIGRYNWSRPDCLQEIICTYPQFEIRFCTAHRSKGLEVDYVIVLDLIGGEYGFPCQIADDPLLSLVLAKDNSFHNAEERRLFYVSITRAKKHVFMLIDRTKQVSSFVEEILENGYEYNFRGSIETRPVCSICRIGEIINIEEYSGKPAGACNNPFCDNRLQSNLPTIKREEKEQIKLEEPKKSELITHILTSDGLDLINLSTYFGRIEPGKSVNERAKIRLSQIGLELGFQTFVDYPINNPVDREQISFISVVWKKDYNSQIAFQVRSSEFNINSFYHMEDRDLLLSFKADGKYLVNVSEKNGLIVLCKVNNTNIQAIQNKEPISTTLRSKAENSYFTNESGDNKSKNALPDASKLSELFGKIELGANLHKRAQYKIGKIGENLGYEWSCNYSISNLLGDGRNRQINVVWKEDNSFLAAFEIRIKNYDLDIITTVKDRRKLEKFNSKEKYVVNISERTGEAHFLRVIQTKERSLSSAKQIAPSFQEQNVLHGKNEKAYDVSKIRLKYPKAYEKWTNQEDSQLIAEHNKGLTITQISIMHQRQKGAIRSRLIKIGLISES
jgi:DNA helicase IV